MPAEHNKHNLRAIIGSLDDVVFLISKDHRFLEVWTADDSKLFMPRDAFLGKPITEVFPGDFGDNFIQLINKAIETKQPQITEYKHPQDNRWYNARITHVEMGDEGEGAATMLVRDVTDRRMAEEELKSNQQTFRELVELAGQYIFELDRKNQFTYVSPMICKLYEYSEEEMIGTSPIDYMPPDDKERVAMWFQHYRVNYLPFKGLIHQAVTKSGKLLWVQVSAIPTFDRNGEFTGFRGAGMDLTERKNYEDQLILAKEEAEQASIAKAQFLSTMSHELRTPLNAVIGISHLLLSSSPREDQVDNLDTLRFSAENLLALINDVLDYSKIDAGKVTLEEVPFRLNEILSGISRSHQLSTIRKGIDISVDRVSDDVLIGDPIRLAQILNNLMSNAVKFTDKGSVILKVVEKKRSSDHIAFHFSVNDTGIGISIDKLESIFESFSQASTETSRLYGGTGLGLTITKRLLSMMGSDIEVHSEVGKGSAFSFTLKFKIGTTQDAVSLDGGEPIELPQDLSGYKILLVEDNRINQMLARQFLSRWEIETDTADNGQDAVKLLREGGIYDLVLMDLQMPVMDGYKASKEIRTFNKEIPIIALTASALIDVRKKVLAAGMNDYLSKPFRPKELYEKIARHLPAKTA